MVGEDFEQAENGRVSRWWQAGISSTQDCFWRKIHPRARAHILGSVPRRSDKGRSKFFSSCSPAACWRKGRVAYPNQRATLTKP